MSNLDKTNTNPDGIITMTDSENNAETKDTAKPGPATTAPYIKKDDTAGSPQAESEKNKSSITLTVSLSEQPS